MDAPAMRMVPSPTMPVPYWLGSKAVSSGWSAMSMRAVTPEATGAAAVPTVSVPSGATWRLATSRRVETSVRKFKAPPPAILTTLMLAVELTS